MSRVSTFLIGWLFLLQISAAHHSPKLHFDANQFIQIEGTLTEVKWQNPHIQLKVNVVGDDDNEVEWLVDSVGILALSRRGVSKDDYKIGTTIRLAGFRGRRNPAALYATNTLLPDGREFLEGSSPGPQWTDELVMSGAEYRAGLRENSVGKATSVFGMWGMAPNNTAVGGAGRSLWIESYPLTERAKGVQANWDPISQNPFIYCENGMPAIMDSTTPMEISMDGDDIVIRVEEQDAVRRIYMGGQPDAAIAGPYGVSTGRWIKSSLEVTTIDIEFPWFDQSGIPQTDTLQLVELFHPNDDGVYLDYTLTASDPDIFTEPVVLERRWVWTPGEKIKPYECIWERDDL